MNTRLRAANPSRLRRLETRARRSTPPPPAEMPAEADDVVARGPVSADEDDAIAEHFFSRSPPELPVAPDHAHALELALDPPPRTAPPARRARFLRIVKMSVVACALLCVTATLRVALGRGEGEVHAAPRTATVETAAAPAAPERASAPVVSAPVVSVAEPAAAEPAPADPRGSDAAKAKRAALGALEAHRLDEALAAATSATILDATDGEAWLVLGAVHQDAGRLAEAASAYRTCTTQGRVDPRGECAAMLRSFGSMR